MTFFKAAYETCDAIQQTVIKEHMHAGVEAYKLASSHESKNSWGWNEYILKRQADEPLVPENERRLYGGGRFPGLQMIGASLPALTYRMAVTDNAIIFATWLFEMTKEPDRTSRHHRKTIMLREQTHPSEPFREVQEAVHS